MSDSRNNYYPAPDYYQPFDPRNMPRLWSDQIQDLLDHNALLITTIDNYRAMGLEHEIYRHLAQLHRNLMFLANLADSVGYQYDQY